MDEEKKQGEHSKKGMEREGDREKGRWSPAWSGLPHGGVGNLLSNRVRDLPEGLRVKRKAPCLGQGHLGHPGQIGGELTRYMQEDITEIERAARELEAYWEEHPLPAEGF
jgi:hypothetical protein